MPYTLNWSSYQDSFSIGKTAITIADQTANSTTSLVLTGKGYQNYGQYLMQNLMHLLENFASNVEPVGATVGQLWYKTDVGVVYVCVTPSVVGTNNLSLKPPATTNSWVALSNNAITPAIITSGLGYTPVNKTGDSMTGNLTLDGVHTVTGLPTPVNPSDAAPKSYVDSAITGLSWKAAVQCATIANLNSLAGLQTVDGYHLASGDRILVKNQANPVNNGIYLASSGQWLRSDDAGGPFGNGASELYGAATFVENGTTNGDTAWVQTTPPPISLGITNIVWAQFFGSGTYAPGSGISITGNTITNIGITSLVAGNNIVLTPTPGNSSIVKIDANFTLTTAAYANNLTGGSLGNIPYQTGGGSTSFIPTGSSNMVLVGGVTPSWSNTPTLTGTNFTGIPVSALSTSSINIATSTGLSGGGVVALGGTITLTNAGVTSLVNGTDISVSGATGAVTINDTSTLATVTSRGAVTTTAVSITNATASTSTATGALTVPNGGIATGGALWAGSLHTTGTLTVQSNTVSTNNTTGAAIITGGLGVGGDIHSATVTTTGTLTANGLATMNAALNVVNSDITTYRTGGTTGVIFLSNSGTKYLYNDGTNYQLPAQGLVVGGAVQGTHFISTDSPSMQFGGSAGAGIYHDASNMAVRLANTTGTLYFQTLNGAATMATLDHSGNFTATADLIAFSDRRVKLNINTITSALDKVNALRGVSFTRVDTNRNSIGVIAQEVEEVIPEVVHTNESGMKSVAYGNLAGVFIEAIKELTAKVAALEAELKSLKG